MSTTPNWVSPQDGEADDRHRPSKVRRVAVIGNYVPRQCGIATFTTDVCESLANEYEGLKCIALAMNDTPDGYAYPARVRFAIDQEDLASYERAADFLDLNNVDVVCLQHEYGIYGGEAGRHILALLRELHMPVITTLHTVLRDPEPRYRAVMGELTELSDRLITMSQRGVEFLRDVYDVPVDKIDMIHHGIPDVPFVDPNFYKDQFGVEGKHVALTFGLLSPNKGIEQAIRAVPAVVQRYPNFAYIVLGATHPHLIRREGHKYRDSLVRLAEELGVSEHVIFHSRFVDLEELIEYIGAADLYLTPYLNEAQITSGTLAYAAGAGKAVISTPYWHAQELLADGRGRLTPFGDSDAIAHEMIDLLDNEAERHAIRKRAYMAGREMIWPAVARRYMRSFMRAREERVKQPRKAFEIRDAARRPAKLPTLSLAHVNRLTDRTGIIQHAIGSLPNYDHGYCADDNARALILATLLLEFDDNGLAKPARALTETYLAFLWHAFDKQTGRFRNFMGYDRRWLERAGSDDSQGRSLWGLGVVAGRSSDARLRFTAGRLFNLALPAMLESTSPRTWAYGLLAIHEYLRRFYGDSAAQQAREKLADRLFALYLDRSSADWPWFEDELTYVNAKMPHALLLCGRWMMRGEMSEAGLRALDWLSKVQRPDGEHFVPIGNRGFFKRGGERARFDQQPIEAHAMVSACLEAFQVTSDRRWLTEAQIAFEWFLGRNDVGVPMYDVSTGGCCDGLHPQRANQNQGAESTLAFLLALVEMRIVTGSLRRGDSGAEIVSRDPLARA